MWFESTAYYTNLNMNKITLLKMLKLVGAEFSTLRLAQRFIDLFTVKNGCRSCMHLKFAKKKSLFSVDPENNFISCSVPYEELA